MAAAFRRWPRGAAVSQADSPRGLKLRPPDGARQRPASKLRPPPTSNELIVFDLTPSPFSFYFPPTFHSNHGSLRFQASFRPLWQEGDAYVVVFGYHMVTLDSPAPIFCRHFDGMQLSIDRPGPLGCLNSTKLVLQVGLDAAGKTTILYKLKLGEIVTTIPTIGQYRPSFMHEKDSQFSGHARLQCRNGRVQEHLLHRVGCRRTGQDPPTLETLSVKPRDSPRTTL